MKDHEISCFKCLYYKGFTHLNLEIHIFKRISIQILMQYEFMILYVKFLRLSGCSKTVLKYKFLRTRFRKEIYSLRNGLLL